jgi:hypothetical protein
MSNLDTQAMEIEGVERAAARAMKRPSFQLSRAEQSAREMMEEYRDARGSEITGAEIAVLRVFTAMWANSLPADRIVALAELMGSGMGSEFIPAGLSRLVRAKILRTRNHRGQRYYEVNY